MDHLREEVIFMQEDTKYSKIAKASCDAPFRAQQKWTELSGLLEFLDGRNVKNILEIGVFKGGTIQAWVEVADPSAYILGVDLPNGKYGGGFDDLEKRNIEALAKDNQKIELYALDSHEDSTLELIKGKCNEFDFIFIDGDHTLEGVTKDFEMYKSLLKKGGVIAFHDVVVHTLYPEVKIYELWAELKKQYEYKEFIDLDYVTDHGYWGGIGAIIL